MQAGFAKPISILHGPTVHDHQDPPYTFHIRKVSPSTPESCLQQHMCCHCRQVLQNQFQFCMARPFTTITTPPYLPYKEGISNTQSPVYCTAHVLLLQASFAKPISILHGPTVHDTPGPPYTFHIRKVSPIPRVLSTVQHMCCYCRQVLQNQFQFCMARPFTTPLDPPIPSI